MFEEGRVPGPPRVGRTHQPVCDLQAAAAAAFGVTASRSSDPSSHNRAP